VPQPGDWLALGRADVAAIDGPDPDRYEVRRRSRGDFLRVLGRGLWAAARLWVRSRRLRAEWQAAFPRLTGEAFWRRYLGVEGEGADGRGGAGRDAA
jgi:hypothetical protein